VGDIAHSRVARSNAALLTALGAEVTVAGPAEFLPEDVSSWPVRATTDFDAALHAEPDAVMMLRVQHERRTAGDQVSLDDYVAAFCLTEERANYLPADTIVMHPGPMNRGVEIASVVADSDRSVVLDQVRNGVSVRMAVLYEVWGDRS